MIVAGFVLALAGCGGTAGKAPDAIPDRLPPGQYEVTGKVDALRSTDKTTPLTKLKLGDTIETTACVGADGKPPANLFESASGETCSPKDSYVRSGRLNASFSCSRAGRSGEIMVSADGHYTADGFTAKGTTTTYFAGSGDYVLTAALTGKRVGQCHA
jgi:Protein of unknown function (DUF3617)